MLKILLATTMLIPSTLLAPMKYLFSITAAHAMLITLLALKWLYPASPPGLQTMNQWLALDHISTPLILMSAWILPLMIIASQHHMSTEPAKRKRLFLMTAAALQTTLMITFTTTNLMMFYIMFEATLVPTLILITRWGNQAERLTAGTYFLFYTLAGSMPLLIAILLLTATQQHTSYPLFTLTNHLPHQSWTNTAIWLACLLAFLVKMPLYSLHLWLPKAHVEAPVAGSMILAAVLLKLGGYGIIRLTPLLSPTTQTMYFPFIVLSLWGMLMTSLICLRQHDLKAIIAYSSVSHMGLIIAAALIQTPWSTGGAMILMIAHGLTSSMLFCLANTNYERTHTRTLLITRGLQLSLPLMTTWWLLSNLMNMALPPTINLMGELMIITSLLNWSTLTIALTGLATLLTATYSLHIFLTTQQNKKPQYESHYPTQTREHLIMTLHLAPLALLILHPKLMFNL